jgi:hypothetical protein
MTKWLQDAAIATRTGVGLVEGNNLLMKRKLSIGLIEHFACPLLGEL